MVIETWLVQLVYMAFTDIRTAVQYYSTGHLSPNSCPQQTMDENA